MRFQPRNDPETPPDHWKLNVVQKTSRIPTRADLKSSSPGTGGDAAKRRRLSVILRYLIILSFFAGVGAVCYFAWQDSSNPHVVAENTEESAPGKAIEYINDGSIPKQWVLELLGSPLPPILDVKRKLDEVPQIKKVEVRRLAGGVYEVKIAEREPVARIRIRGADGNPTVNLVSTDGIIYDPINIGTLTVQNLPMLEDSAPRRAGNRIVLDGFEPVADFIRLARVEHKNIYREWLSVSLKDFDGRPSAPGAVFRVKPRLNTQAADSAAVVEIVFSPIDYAEELRLLALPLTQEVIRQKLRTVDRAKTPAYRLDLSMMNTSNPSVPYSEPRLQAVSAAPRQP